MSPRSSRKTITGRRERQEQRRPGADELFAARDSRTEVARRLKVNWHAMHESHKAWQNAGEAGLRSGGKPGPREKFPGKHREKLAVILRQGAVAAG